MGKNQPEDVPDLVDDEDEDDEDEDSSEDIPDLEGGDFEKVS